MSQPEISNDVKLIMSLFSPENRGTHSSEHTCLPVSNTFLFPSLQTSTTSLGKLLYMSEYDKDS